MNTKSTVRAILLAAALSGAVGLAVARSSNMVELGRQSAVTTDAKPLSVGAMRKAILAGGAVHSWKPTAASTRRSSTWPTTRRAGRSPTRAAPT